MKKWLLGALIIGVISWGAWQLWAKKPETSKAADKNRAPQTVIVMPAYVMALQDNIEALGTAMADEAVDITPQTNATINEIHFKEGQTVKRNDLLVVFKQQQEVAELAAAQAQVKSNQSELNRLQKLLQHQATSQREYEDRVAALETAKQNIAQIQARLDDLTLRAPFNGVVGLRHFSVGARVSPGQVITHLDAIEQIKVDFSLPSALLTQIKTGTPFTASSNVLGAQQFNGKITTLDSRIDVASGGFLVRGIMDNPQHILKPGLLLRINVQQPARQALVIAEESIIQKQQQHAVFVVTDEQSVVSKQVQIGVRQPGLVEVIAGLAVGERVIVRGMGNIKTGDRVSVQQQWDRLPDPATP
jgi:membrane fusion protein (multidrug efflux system)